MTLNVVYLVKARILARLWEEFPDLGENGVIAPGQARERGKGCKERIAETFRRDPAGNQSRPVEPAGSRK